MLHRLCGSPSIPLSFNLAVYSPGGVLNALVSSTKGRKPLTLSTHRLRRGLPGYLILFDPYAFAHHCQLQTRKSPSPLVFLHISAHFTATHGIPLPLCTQVFQFPMTSTVEWAFTSDLKPPTRALRPIIPDNACHLRITAAACT